MGYKEILKIQVLTPAFSSKGLTSGVPIDVVLNIVIGAKLLRFTGTTKKRFKNNMKRTNGNRHIETDSNK